MPRASGFLIAITIALIGMPAQAVHRAYVASFGSDANAATGCGFAAPCRTFAAAVPVVDSGGEVLALDSIGYGMVTIDKAITLTAAPGAFAGISVSAGAIGVTIATPGVYVTLRGLNINNVGSAGGEIGVAMTSAGTLLIENCVISNFWSGDGVVLRGGAKAQISSSRIFGNIGGILVQSVTAATTTSAAISDSVLTGNIVGVFSHSTHATGSANVSLFLTVATNNNIAMRSQSGAGGSVLLTVSDSMVTGNVTGLSQAGAGSVLESLGNNTVRQNTSNTSGTITPVAPM